MAVSPQEREPRRRSAMAVPPGARRAPDHFGLTHWVGRTRFIVLVAVAAVLLVALALFVLAGWLAVLGVWQAAGAALRGELDGTHLTVQFLEVISALLKAVIFYLMGVGLYSLFVEPLNLTTALGVETLADLERKVVSIVILILAVTLLEHFIRWEDPDAIISFGITLALGVAALVAFQFVSLRGEQHLYTPGPDVQVRAQRELYRGEREGREVTVEEADTAMEGESSPDGAHPAAGGRRDVGSLRTDRQR